MTQTVASQPYCLENSNQLTRPGLESFYHIDGSNQPIIIDKDQAKRLYRLQRAPNVNTSLHLDSSNLDYETQGYFESTLRNQLNESSIEPTTSVYHRPTDMSDISMARFSFGKARLDPQRSVPSQMTTVRNHPAAITKIRHQQSFNNEVVPRFTDRLVPDRTVRARIGPGGGLNPEEACQQAEKYFQDRRRLSSQPNLSYNPRKLQRSMTNEFKRDELARHFMYTSAQQAASDDVPWDSKLPPMIPVPTTTFEADGSNPLLKSTSLPSFYDSRTQEVLQWDRQQLRNVHFIRKPFANVAPLPRAQQISSYSGTIGGDNIQDIDNPTIDFKPYTVLRTEQPKLGLIPSKIDNIPGYTGKSHWTKVDPVSHYDQSGRAYTTTAAFQKSLPIDYSSYRHAGVHGQLSRAVTTVMPQNPFNQIGVSSSTINGSLDSRPHVLLRQLPGNSVSSSAKDNYQKEEQIINNETNN